MTGLSDLAPARAVARGAGDLYAGADLERARRFQALVFCLGVPVFGVFAPIAPRAAAVAPYAAGASAALCLAAALLVLRGRRVTWSLLLAQMYVAALAVALMLWLGGGWASPYDTVFFALIMTVAMIHPARRAAPFVAFAAALTFTPLLYGGADGRLAEVLVSLLLWIGAAIFCSSIMAAVRAQRLALAARGDRALDEARRDALTGLENRRSFEETFAAQLEVARAAGRSLSLAVADVDGFKPINDRYGHPAGDAVLAAVARALSAGSRDGDRVYRWAGDEFLVVLDGADAAAASEICARVELDVAHATLDPDGRAVTLTIGWAQDDGAMSADELLARADAAMLWRKSARRRAAARPATRESRSRRA